MYKVILETYRKNSLFWLCVAVMPLQQSFGRFLACICSAVTMSAAG